MWTLFFLDSCFSWLSVEILFSFLRCKILAWKTRSWPSDKIGIDWILSSEAKNASPDKILVFSSSYLPLLLQFLRDSCCSWILAWIFFLKFLTDAYNGNAVSSYIGMVISCPYHQASIKNFIGNMYKTIRRVIKTLRQFYIDEMKFAINWHFGWTFVH